VDALYVTRGPVSHAVVATQRHIGTYLSTAALGDVEDAIHAQVGVARRSSTNAIRLEQMQPKNENFPTDLRKTINDKLTSSAIFTCMLDASASE
jgi:hypothetical protein